MSKIIQYVVDTKQNVEHLAFYTNLFSFVITITFIQI